MIAVYAGSLDPITYGHFDVITRASKLFDHVVVGIGSNGSKTGLFIPGERQDLARAVCGGLPNVRVEIFNDLLVSFCKRQKAYVIVRGLRAVSDFEAELGMSQTNSCLDPDIETIFLATRPEFSFISSSMVKEIAKHGGPIDPYVHPIVAEAIKRKIGFVRRALPKTPKEGAPTTSGVSSDHETDGHSSP